MRSYSNDHTAERHVGFPSDAGITRFHWAQVIALPLTEQKSVDPLAIPLPPRSLLAPWQVNRLMRHIETNLDQPIRLAELAFISKLSIGYFSVAFRQTFGTTPQTFLAYWRIEHAKRLMLSTRQSLTQIALVCGFYDQAHFCRRFRAIMGVTPNAWRRQFSWPLEDVENYSIAWMQRASTESVEPDILTARKSAEPGHRLGRAEGFS